MNELTAFLLSKLYVDFRGEISLEQVRQLLSQDESRAAQALLQKLTEDKGVDDLLITLAEALSKRVVVSEQVMTDQLATYAES